MLDAHVGEAVRLAALLRKQMLLFPPIDLASISRALEIKVRIEPLPSDVSGFYFVTPRGRAIIGINLDMPVPRQRFTWAHEIGHHVLGCGLRVGFHMQGRANRTERICDRFAVELLMPAQLVISRVSSIREAHPLRAIRHLMREFGVSNQAMLRRLGELGLLDRLRW